MLRLINISKYIPTKNMTWCYGKGFYRVPYHQQYESRDNENEIINRMNKIKSYGKWIEDSDKSIIRIERQKKIKEFLNQYY